MASSFSFANIKSIIRLEFVSIRGDKNFAFNTANCLDVLNSFLSRSISKNKSNKSNKSFSNSRYFSFVKLFLSIAFGSIEFVSTLDRVSKNSTSLVEDNSFSSCFINPRNKKGKSLDEEI